MNPCTSRAHIFVQLVKMKGRVACEISTCECIIATEAIFRGLFTALEPAEAAAVLCTLVNQNKTEVSLAKAAVPAALREALEHLQALTAELGSAQSSVGLKVDPEEYVQASVRPSLTEVRPPPRLSFSPASSFTCPVPSSRFRVP